MIWPMPSFLALLATSHVAGGASLTPVAQSVNTNAAVRAVDFTSDGTYVVSAGEDAVLRMWNADDLSLMQEQDLNHTVYDLETSPDIPNLVLTGEGGWKGSPGSDTFRVLSLETFGIYIVNGTVPGGYMYCVAMSEKFQDSGADHVYLAGSGFYGDIQIYKLNVDTKELTPEPTTEIGDKRVDAIKWLGVDKIARSLKGKIEIWMRSDGSLLETLTHGGQWENFMDVNGDLIVSGSDGGTIVLWNQTGLPDPMDEISSDGTVYCIAFSEDGSKIVVGRTTSITVYSTYPLTELVTYENAHNSRIFSIAFSPTDNMAIASASSDGYVKLWSLYPSTNPTPSTPDPTPAPTPAPTNAAPTQCKPESNDCGSHDECCDDLKCKGNPKTCKP